MLGFEWGREEENEDDLDDDDEEGKGNAKEVEEKERREMRRWVRSAMMPVQTRMQREMYLAFKKS